MSILAPAQLALHVYAPVWSQTREYIGDYTDDCVAYEHTLLANGGMWSGSLTLRQSPAGAEQRLARNLAQARARAEAWLESGLGRHVEVRALGSTEIFSGFVNEVEVAISGYRRRIGPLTDVVNKARLVCAYDDPDLPITGIPLTTDWLEDTASQARWGVRARTYAAGGITLDRVDTTLAMHLERYKSPPRSEELDLLTADNASQVEVRLALAGYAQALDAQPYASTTRGTVETGDKIKAILGGDDNSQIARDYASIERNPTLVGAYETDHVSAWSLIRSLVAGGDAQLFRWTFGVYGGRRAHYHQVDNTISYLRPLGSGMARVQGADAQELRAWEVQAGRYIGVAGLVPGRALATNLQTDNRVLFAESVQFRAPDELTINGAHAFRIEQRLAGLGLNGVG